MAWQRKQDGGTLADLFPAPQYDQFDQDEETVSPVTTIERPEQPAQPQVEQAETLEAEEARLLSLLTAAEEFRKQQARREAEQQAKEAHDRQRLEEVTERLSRIRAQKAAAAARVEAERLAGVLAEYEAGGHLQKACEGAVQQYAKEAQYATTPVEACRSILEDRLHIPAPPAECWTMSDPLFWEVHLANGRVTVSVNAQPGQEPPMVLLTIRDELFVGAKGIVITDRATFGNWLRENKGAPEALGVSLDGIDIPDPVDISGWGLA